MNKKLASITTSAHTHCVGVNPLTEIGVSNHKADKPLPSGFFSSVKTLCALPLWWACSGGTFACAGFFVAGTPTSLHACHPDWRLGCGLFTPHKEYTYHV